MIDLHVVGDECAVAVGVPHICQRQACVITLGVVVARPTLQPSGLEARFGTNHGALAQHPVAAHIPEQREQIVEPEACGELEAGDAAAGIHGKQKRQWPYEVRSDLEENAPFAAGFEYQRPVTVLEIPQAAVDQARGARTRPGAEVSLVDERGADPPHCRIPRDPGTGDSCPDHQQVHRVSNHGGEVARASLVRKRSVH